MTMNKGRGSNVKYLPYAFTELGVAMLSSVLKSETAISVNREIMRAFVEFRHLAVSLPVANPNADIAQLRKDFEELDERITFRVAKTVDFEVYIKIGPLDGSKSRHHPFR